MTGAVAGYLLCLILVPIYVSMFPIWKYLSTSWGEDIFIYLPTIALIILLGCCFFIWLNTRKKRLPASKIIIALGVLLCVIGLFVPDPEFPVKRIHVAEYLVLSLIGRYAMSRFLKGLPLLFFSACFAAILGIHDEFLQGIHPARTFGLGDMLVNSLGSFGGGLIWHGLRFFSTDAKSTESRTGQSPNDYCYLGWLFVAVALLIGPAVYFRGLIIEIWTILPLLGGLVYLGFYRNSFNPDWRHGIDVLSAASMTLALYPIITRLPKVVFY